MARLSVLVVRARKACLRKAVLDKREVKKKYNREYYLRRKAGLRKV